MQTGPKRKPERTPDHEQAGKAPQILDGLSRRLTSRSLVLAENPRGTCDKGQNKQHQPSLGRISFQNRYLPRKCTRLICFESG